MKLRRLCLPLLACAYLPICAGSDDTGTVVELFTTPTRGIAIHLSNGFPNALAAGECTMSNGWAGHLTADPVLKAALLSAKAHRADGPSEDFRVRGKRGLMEDGSALS